MWMSVACSVLVSLLETMSYANGVDIVPIWHWKRAENVELNGVRHLFVSAPARAGVVTPAYGVNGANVLQ